MFFSAPAKTAGLQLSFIGICSKQACKSATVFYFAAYNQVCAVGSGLHCRRYLHVCVSAWMEVSVSACNPSLHRSCRCRQPQQLPACARAAPLLF
ncbi:hypothetical protein [Methanimicrococcus hongohii]|uniref:hypothetical protein n=1 Tax=Methanimicrococcus hongohii TaxID=3028295 RepID=UPI00292FD8CF|nr:hypothetical protein [Methanimicrococcus sp. Hf6]